MTTGRCACGIRHRPVSRCAPAGHTGGVHSVAFSPDGKTLVSAGDDRTLRLWDVATAGLARAPLRGHPGGVHSVAFSPDGKPSPPAAGTGCACGMPPPPASPAARPCKATRAVMSVGAGVVSIAFSPDGKALSPAATSRPCGYGTPPPASLACAALTATRTGVSSVAFSPDGKDARLRQPRRNPAAVGRRHRTASPDASERS